MNKIALQVIPGTNGNFRLELPRVCSAWECLARVQPIYTALMASERRVTARPYGFSLCEGKPGTRETPRVIRFRLRVREGEAYWRGHLTAPRSPRARMAPVFPQTRPGFERRKDGRLTPKSKLEVPVATEPGGLEVLSESRCGIVAAVGDCLRGTLDNSRGERPGNPFSQKQVPRIQGEIWIFNVLGVIMLVEGCPW